MERGRPLKFDSVEKLDSMIEDYFKSCFKVAYDKNGVPLQDPETGDIVKIQNRPYTLAGLASYLDTNRQTLLNYEHREDFFDSINRAKAKIQAYTEERLFDRDGVNGAKFSLINNWKEDQYSDQKNVDHTSNGETISITVNKNYNEQDRPHV